MNKPVVVYQPRYFPKLHYLARARQSEVFIIYDDVEFSRNSPQHRAEINFGSRQWLTIPVKHMGTKIPIVDAKIDMSQRWIDKHHGTLVHKYGSSANIFEEHYQQFEGEDTVRLVEVTVPLLRELFEQFDISTEIRRSSEMAVEYPDEASEYIAKLVAEVDGDTYISGRKGFEEYLQITPFDERGIDVSVQEWTPTWNEGNVCALDVLFNADTPSEWVR